MVELNKKGYTYGASINNSICWKSDKDGICDVVMNFSTEKRIDVEIETNYNVPNNTYNASDAILITEDEYNAAISKVFRLIDYFKKKTIKPKTKKKL